MGEINTTVTKRYNGVTYRECAQVIDVIRADAESSLLQCAESALYLIKRLSVSTPPDWEVPNDWVVPDGWVTMIRNVAMAEFYSSPFPPPTPLFTRPDSDLDCKVRVCGEIADPETAMKHTIGQVVDSLTAVVDKCTEGLQELARCFLPLTHVGLFLFLLNAKIQPVRQVLVQTAGTHMIDHTIALEDARRN